jgi:toxin ParE1/3/4
VRFRVHIIGDAEDDIFDICTYIARNDSAGNAPYVLGRLHQTCESLSENPRRGHLPPELERIGVSEYREMHFKPYRIIYNISDRDVYLYCVLDGRRDLKDLMERRLLR